MHAVDWRKTMLKEADLDLMKRLGRGNGVCVKKARTMELKGRKNEISANIFKLAIQSSTSEKKEETVGIDSKRGRSERRLVCVCGIVL